MPVNASECRVKAVLNVSYVINSLQRDVEDYSS